MPDPTESYFSVAAYNEAAALAHLNAKGFPPSRVEKDDDGLCVLAFDNIPEDKMFGLAEALPVHLSAKIGIIGDPAFN